MQDDWLFLERLVQEHDSYLDDLIEAMKHVKCWRCGQAIIPRERNTCFGCGTISELLWKRTDRTSILNPNLKAVLP